MDEPLKQTPACRDHRQGIASAINPAQHFQRRTAVLLLAATNFAGCSGETMMADPSALPLLLPTIHEGSPSWSPDGTRIAFYSDREGNAEIYTMSADGTDRIRLTNDPADEGYPAWSPDGSQITFDTNRDGNFEIYLMNSDGSEPRRLTDHAARDVSAAWSPDGSRIVFMSDREEIFGLWEISIDRSSIRRLNVDSNSWFPQFSPDGVQLAFHVDRDVHVLDMDSSSLTRLTTDPANGMYPSWSPDGKQLAFMSWREGSTEIWTMNSAGSEPIKLTETASGDAIDPRYSPDGSRIAFVWVPNGLRHLGPRYIYAMDADGTNIARLSPRP